MKEKIEIPSCESCSSRKYSIFCELQSKQLDELAYSKGCNIYQKGQTIFYEGSRPTGLYCIHTGKVKIFKLGIEGRYQIVRLAKEADVLGYRSLLSGEMYAASAVALEDTTVCFIPKSLFFEMLQENNSLSLKVMQLLSKDLKKAEDGITDIAQKTVRERLAEALLMLKETYGTQEDGDTLNATLTREDMASIVGTATETVIRLLSEFKHDKMIFMKGRSIKILNLPKLIKTANIND